MTKLKVVRLLTYEGDEAAVRQVLERSFRDGVTDVWRRSDGELKLTIKTMFDGVAEDTHCGAFDAVKEFCK